MKPESLAIKDLVCFENEFKDVQEVRLKVDQLDDTLMAYCRMIVNLKDTPKVDTEIDLLKVANEGKVNFTEPEMSDDLT